MLNGGSEAGRPAKTVRWAAWSSAILVPTGLKVSVLSFGTMSFGGGPQSAVGTTGVDDARRQIDRCLDAGINFFDSADVYSSGESERILGEALQGRRERVVLATKVNGRMGEGPTIAGCRAATSSARVRPACNASARIGSTCIRCTRGMATPRSRRRSRRWTRWCSRARCATSAARTTRRGT